MAATDNPKKQAPIRDWKKLEQSLRNYARWMPRGVMGSDVDLVLHATHPNGDRWLVMEFKEQGQKLPLGQQILLEGLKKLPGFTVVIVWGPQNNGDYLLGMDWDGEVNEKALASMVRAWWRSAKQK